MPDLATIIVQASIGAVPLGAAWFAFRASTDANRKSPDAPASTLTSGNGVMHVQ